MLFIQVLAGYDTARNLDWKSFQEILSMNNRNAKYFVFSSFFAIKL